MDDYTEPLEPTIDENRKLLVWDRLGENIKDCVTSEEAIKFANMNYQVKRASLLAHIPVGEELPGVEQEYIDIIVPNRYSTYRTDNNAIFGVVSDIYHIVQNINAFQFFDKFIKDGIASYSTTGVIGKGEAVFVSAKFNEPIRIKDEVIDKYILLSMNHDGKGAILVMFTPIRVICNNTLALAIKECKHKVSIRHSADADEKLKASAKVLHMVTTSSTRLTEILTSMMNAPMKDIEVMHYIADLLLIRGIDYLVNERTNQIVLTDSISQAKANVLRNAWHYYNTGPGQKAYVGTVYGAYNAITGYFHNVKYVKDDTNTNTKKLKSNLLGPNYGVMQNAFINAVNKCLL